MKILAINWLDLENPQAGGAEVHFFEIFRRLVEAGDQVQLITSGWAGAPARDEIQGIPVRRIGGRHTFALRGRGAVRAALREQAWDVVVEDINKLPLFLPTLTRLPVYAIIPHLFGETAFREAAPPVATVVWLAERMIPRVYRRAAFHAISESTRDDLVARGVGPERIRVIHPGVDAAWFRPDPAEPRAPVPTFLYVGRLKRYKGVEAAIRAAAFARTRVPDLTLEIAGQGDDRARLERIAAEVAPPGAVRFLGFVSEDEKRRLLRRAWAVVFPSAKEGWGISNVEAAACGTPAIAADRPGLRESVLDGRTGALVPWGDVEALAAAILRFATDPARVVAFGVAARTFAESLSWTAAARATRDHLHETVRAARRGESE